MHINIHQGGNREAGALWVSNSAAEEEAALSWVPKGPSPSGGLGARGDIRNLAHALADAADPSATTLGPKQQQQQQQQQSKAIDLARGRVLSASFVWLDASTPGLSLVLSASESEQAAGSGTAIVFLDFQGGKDAEPAARKALRMLQQGIGGGGGGGSGGSSTNTIVAPVRASEPVQEKAAAVEAMDGGAAEEGTETEEEEEEDLAVLVRRFLKVRLVLCLHPQLSHLFRCPNLYSTCRLHVSVCPSLPSDRPSPTPGAPGPLHAACTASRATRCSRSGRSKRPPAGTRIPRPWSPARSRWRCARCGRWSSPWSPSSRA